MYFIEVGKFIVFGGRIYIMQVDDRVDLCLKMIVINMNRMNELMIEQNNLLVL